MKLRWSTYSRDRRTGFVFEYRLKLQYGLRVSVSAHGVPGYPFPSCKEDVAGWYSFIWLPEDTKAISARLCKSVAAAKRQGVRRLNAQVNNMIRKLTAIQAQLEVASQK